MNFKGILNNINQKPEHVRARYVWGCVILSMLFIFSIFGASIGTTFQGNKDETNNLQAQINQAQPSITEVLNDGKEMFNKFQNTQADYNHILSGNATEEEIRQFLEGQASDEEIQQFVNEYTNTYPSPTTTINSRSAAPQEQETNPEVEENTPDNSNDNPDITEQEDTETTDILPIAN